VENVGAPTSFVCKICAYKTLPRIHDQFYFKSNSLQTRCNFLPYIMIYNTYGTKPKQITQVIHRNDFESFARAVKQDWKLKQLRNLR
jgi:hypothetical protein